MKSKLCKRLNIQFPLFAFSHCRDVVAEVSKAGGFGVLGAAGHTPESLEVELNWLDAHVGGASYGVDLIVPTSMDAKEGGLTAEEIEARIPPEHKAYVNSILARHGMPRAICGNGVRDDFGDSMREVGRSVLTLCLRIRSRWSSTHWVCRRNYDRLRAAGRWSVH
jgi:NAD(P)H-dependent flavin oxidoreductase YrpB (nitropropane dioxygenase family)